MKLDRRVVRRLGRKPARKTTSRFSLEQLEARQLLAGSVTISLAGTTTTITAPILANLGDYGNSTDYSITPSAVAALTSDLTIHANGPITISDPVANFGYNLDAESEAYIAVDADISTTSGTDLTLSNYDLIANSVSLGASVTASGVVFNNSTVSSGGNLTVIGVGYSTGTDPSVYGVYLKNSTIGATGSTHAVNVTGLIDSAITGGGNVGVLVGGGSTIESDDSPVTVTGTSTGMAGDDGYDYGVFVNGGTIRSETGAVSVTGTGGTGSDGFHNAGVLVWASGFIADNPDPASLGTGGTSGAAVITSVSGDVTVTGTGGGTSTAKYSNGVMVNTGGEIGPGALGDVTVTGTGGGGSLGYDDGVYIGNNDDGPAPMITSGGGDVIVDGYGGSSVAGTPGSDGVHVAAGGTISAGGLGDVTVTGSGATLSGTGLVGVRVIGSGATITSSGGDVAVAGVGGGSSTVGNRRARISGSKWLRWGSSAPGAWGMCP